MLPHTSMLKAVRGPFQVTPNAIDLMLIELGGTLPRELTGRPCIASEASSNSGRLLSLGLRPSPDALAQETP